MTNGAAAADSASDRESQCIAHDVTRNGSQRSDLGSSFSRSRDVGEEGHGYSSETNLCDVPASSDSNNIESKNSSTHRIGHGSLDINLHFPVPKRNRKVCHDSSEAVSTVSLENSPEPNAKHTKQGSSVAGSKHHDGSRRSPGPEQTQNHDVVHQASASGQILSTEYQPQETERYSEDEEQNQRRTDEDMVLRHLAAADRFPERPKERNPSLSSTKSKPPTEVPPGAVLYSLPFSPQSLENAAVGLRDTRGHMSHPPSTVSFNKPYVSNGRRGCRVTARATSPPPPGIESRKEKRRRRRMEWKEYNVLTSRAKHNNSDKSSADNLDLNLSRGSSSATSDDALELERGRQRTRSLAIPVRQSSLLAITSGPSSFTSEEETHTRPRSFLLQSTSIGQEKGVFASQQLHDMSNGLRIFAFGSAASHADASTQTDGIPFGPSATVPNPSADAAVQTETPLHDCTTVCQSQGKHFHSPRPWSYEAAISFPQQSLGEDYISDSCSSFLTETSQSHSPWAMLDEQSSSQSTSSGTTTSPHFGEQIYLHQQPQEPAHSSNLISPVPSLPTFKPTRRGLSVPTSAHTTEENFPVSCWSKSEGESVKLTAFSNSSPQLPPLSFPSTSLFPISSSSLPKTVEPALSSGYQPSFPGIEIEEAEDTTFLRQQSDSVIFVSENERQESMSPATASFLAQTGDNWQSLPRSSLSLSGRENRTRSRSNGATEITYRPRDLHSRPSNQSLHSGLVSPLPPDEHLTEPLYVNPRPVPHIPEPNQTAHVDNTRPRLGFFERIREQASSKQGLQQLVRTSWFSKSKAEHGATHENNVGNDGIDDNGEENKKRHNDDPAGIPRRSISLSRRLSRRIRNPRRRNSERRSRSRNVSQSERRDHEIDQGESQMPQGDEQHDANQQQEPRRRFEILSHSRTLFHKMASKSRRLSHHNDTPAAASHNNTNHNQRLDLSIEDFGFPYWQNHEVQQQQQQPIPTASTHPTDMTDEAIYTDARNHDRYDASSPFVTVDSEFSAVMTSRNNHPNRRTFVLSA